MTEPQANKKRNRRFGNKNTGTWLSYVGDCHQLTEFLSKKRFDSLWGPIKFLDALLRGYGQVVFANNPVSGLLIAVALTVANLEASIAGLITASSGLLVSMDWTKGPRHELACGGGPGMGCTLWGSEFNRRRVMALADRWGSVPSGLGPWGSVSVGTGLTGRVFMKQNSASISAGLTVYNPLLVGLVTVSVLPTMYDIQVDPMIWVFMMAAAVLSVYVASALASLLAYMGQHPVPCFTMPFYISQIMLFLIITNMKSYNSYNDLNITMINSTQPFHGPQNVPLVVLQEGKVSKIGETELLELTDYASTLPGNSLKRYQASPPLLPEVSKTLNNEIDTLATSHDSGTDIPRTLVDTSNYFENNDDNISENAHSAGYSINLNGLDKPDNGNETGNVSLLPTGDGMAYGLNLKESFTQSENNLTDTAQDLEGHHVDWGQVFAGVVLSMSQVYGYCDPAASTTMYLAILIYSPIMALFAVLGSTLATLTGLLLSDGQYSPVYEGEWGANGILCATALGGFCFVLTLQSATATIVCTLFGAGLQKVLEEPYNQANLPIMSLPFNLCSILFLFLSSVSKKGFIRPPTLSFPEKHLFEWSQLRHESEENPDVMTEMAQEVEPSSEKKTPLTEQEIA
uniref:Uncharacterized protein n=1 Tax=Timema shepardi TaxID=629360 RepID=A0A7R9B1V7_TIMSH|nr:unnamed protein product [Timema shepardi]